MIVRRFSLVAFRAEEMTFLVPLTAGSMSSLSGSLVEVN